jgi:hypothetical protein
MRGEASDLVQKRKRVFAEEEVDGIDGVEGKVTLC